MSASDIGKCTPPGHIFWKQYWIFPMGRSSGNSSHSLSWNQKTSKPENLKQNQKLQSRVLQVQFQGLELGLFRKWLHHHTFLYHAWLLVSIVFIYEKISSFCHFLIFGTRCLQALSLIITCPQETMTIIYVQNIISHSEIGLKTHK